MATGMVLIIVSRNIDLSVGSLLGFLGYTMAMVQVIWFPDQSVHLADRPGRRRRRWARSSARSRASSSPTAGCPAFIVTLGGFLVWRGLLFQYAQGQTLGPDGPHLRAARRRPDRLARPVAELDRRASSPASGIIYSLISQPPAAARATASRSARCGPR